MINRWRLHSPRIRVQRDPGGCLRGLGGDRSRREGAAEALRHQRAPRRPGPAQALLLGGGRLRPRLQRRQLGLFQEGGHLEEGNRQVPRQEGGVARSDYVEINSIVPSVRQQHSADWKRSLFRSSFMWVLHTLFFPLNTRA